MEEQVLKLIQWALRQPHNEEVCEEIAAKEIANIQRRFVRWAIINVVVLYSEDDSYICLDDEKNDRVFKTIDELFSYWNDNINK